MPKSDPDNSSDKTHTPDPQSIEGLFLSALNKEVGDEREAFLDEICGDDADRRLRIVALLRAYDDAGSFLERPISGLSATQSLDLSFLTKSDDPSLIGMLGPYEVYELIGRGGMGMVFRARDPKLNRIVAIKVLAPELAAHTNARLRFLREAQAAAAISHPHVVTIHAVEDRLEDGKNELPFIVMECIVGQTLQQKLDKQGSLRLTEIVRISQQMADGLAAAHKQGLVHRDIKPANILLENGVERVKISDFGLARAVDDATITRTGEVSGTPQYMSPEQASGERVDHRSDLFSLGCVMYAMCTGRSPFRSTSLVAAIKRVCHDTPRPIEEINPGLPAWLIQFVNQLLNKGPDQRPQSSAEIAKFLEQHLANLQQPEHVSKPVVPQPIAALQQTIVPSAAKPAQTAAAAPTKSIVKQPMFRMGVLVILSPLILTSLAAFLSVNRYVSPSVMPGSEVFVLSVYILVPIGFLLVAGAIAGTKTSKQRKYLWLYMLLGPLGILLYMMNRDEEAAAAPEAAPPLSPAPTPVASSRSAPVTAEEPTNSPKYIPTPVGFMSATLSVLAAAIATAVFMKSSRVSLGSEGIFYIASWGPRVIALGLLAASAVRRIIYPKESIQSIGAWGAAVAGIGLSAYLPFLIAGNFLHWEPLVAALITWIALHVGTVFAVRKALNERSDANHLVAESCRSAGNHYVLYGAGLIANALGYLFSLLYVVDTPGSLDDYAPQVITTCVAIGCVLLSVGIVLRNRAAGKSGTGPGALASYLLLGPLGIILWLSHRDRMVRNELQRLKDGTTEPAPDPIVLEPESSTAVIGRYLCHLGCLLVTLPILQQLATLLLAWAMPGWSMIEPGTILSLLVGAIATALGLGLRRFSDDQPNRQRPLKLWRPVTALLLLASTAGSAICIETQSRRDATMQSRFEQPISNGQSRGGGSRQESPRPGIQIPAEVAPKSGLRGAIDSTVGSAGGAGRSPAMTASNRVGEFVVDIEDDGIQLAVRQLSAFGAEPVPGSEKQVTAFGQTVLSLPPGEYEVVAHDKWFGWAERPFLSKHVTVKESNTTNLAVGRMLSELDPNGAEGLDFFWNGKKSFTAGDLQIVDVIAHLLDELKTGDGTTNLQNITKAYAIQNNGMEVPDFDKFWPQVCPDCIVPAKKEGTWRLAPLPR
jgi:serine/threonine protein kinase